MSTYVMSDIHGVYEKYEEMLKKIKFSSSDEMFVLGDVVDRGSEPIRVLDNIMERGNIHALLGNHELMMYDALTKDSWKMHRMWMENGGAVTECQFYELAGWERDNVIDYIFKLPIVIPEVDVNEIKYYLAHSACVKGDKIIGNLENDYNRIYEAVWSREYPLFSFPMSGLFQDMNNRILITGHTMTWAYTDESPTKVKGHIFTDKEGCFIGIDCGCASYAYGNKKGRLGCLRLDDLKEFYV